MTAANETIPLKARLLGRLLRFMLGSYLAYLLFPVMLSAPRAYLVNAVIWVGGLLALYTGLHFIISSTRLSVNRWIGAFVALAPVVLVYLFMKPAGEFASIAYIGVSLVYMALRGDAGCEVMAFPSLILGKRTHLVCIVFSPIDWLERKSYEFFEHKK